MGLITLAVRKPVTTVMLILVVVILGLTSLSRLPLDLLPALEIPVAIVSVSYPGVGPEEMEKLITSPLEEAMGTVSSIRSISSRTSEGSSLIIAEFNFGTDMNFATLEMREKVDLVRRFFPDGVGAPTVMRIDPDALPVLQLALTSSDSIASQQAFALDVIKPRLERLDGVASVSISGGVEQQVIIDMNQESLLGFGLTLDQVAQVLGAENLNLPGGSVFQGDSQFTVRTLGEFTSLDDIRMLPIVLRSGGAVALGELADVRLDERTRTSYSRLNGQDSLTVAVQKQSGSNTVRAAGAARAEILAVMAEYPDLTMKILFDQSDFIRQAIDNLVEKAVVGGLLAIAMLFLFFGSLPSTLVIATSIPVSVIATFVLLYYNGVTLNLMTLGGFALGIGMLVDNSIVVLENIYRFLEDGHSRPEAAVRGTAEVAMSITAATLTTVAVFLPIVFVEGLTALLFKELALTVSMSLLVSLLVSVTLVPTLASLLLSVGDKRVSKSPISRALGAFESGFERLRGVYSVFLAASLRHRGRTVIAGVMVFALSMGSILSLGSEFIPAIDEGRISLNISLPAVSRLSDTDTVVRDIEILLGQIAEVESVQSSVGGGGGMGVGRVSSNRASIAVQLVALGERERSTAQVADDIRLFTGQIAGALIAVEVASTVVAGGGLGGAPISVMLKGRDVDVLNDWADTFVDVISSVPGTREVRANTSVGVPEVQVIVKREEASRYGLTAAQVANSVRTILSGRVATRYRLDGREIDVVLRGDDRFREDLVQLGQALISTPLGLVVPLMQVADIAVAQGPFTINRSGQVRAVTISSEVFDRDVGSVAADVERALAMLNLPSGYNYEIGGQNRELREAYSQLALALALAVLLVYVILAAQFEALLQPFTIIVAVPLSFSGAALALFATGKPLSVPALIGAIILAGIVVNDAIVLIDYIDVRRGMGESRSVAIAKAGPIRLRPILITTLTTTLGLVPLALGFGAAGEVLAPMAIAVIGGLSAATVLTLVLIPVIYTLFDDMAVWLRHRARGRQSAAMQDEGGS